MPLANYDAFFGGKPGSAAAAHAAMVAKYGEKRGNSVFYARVNMKKKAFGEATQQLREAALLAGPAPSAEITTAAALIESLYLNGFSAVSDGDLSFESVTTAVQAAVSKYAKGEDGNVAQSPCTVVATFLGTCVYEHEGKLYQIDYRLEGTEAKLEGDATEVAAEFVTMPKTMSESRLLIEARPAGVIKSDQINRSLNIIEGTVLITSQSSNGGKGGRRYSDHALRQIAEKADGLPAYLNHVAPDMAWKPRDARDLIGVHRNPRYLASEGKILTDLHVAPHQAPLVFGLAETLGGHIGNSLVSRGAVQMEGTTEVIVEMLDLRSADIVSDPATTKGLFESRVAAGAPLPDDLLGSLILELRESLLKPSPKEEDMDLVTILAHLKANPNDQAVLAENLGFLAKPAASKLQESLTAVTVEKDGLAAKVAVLETEKTKTEKALQEASVTLDGYKAKDALASKRAKIVTVIEAHDLGKQFGKVKGAVSDTFKTILEQAEETQWSAMLDDRFAALKGVPARTVPPTSGLKADDLMEGDDTRPAPITNPHDRLVAAISR
jgi:hypothetical protein